MFLTAPRSASHLWADPCSKRLSFELSDYSILLSPSSSDNPKSDGGWKLSFKVFAVSNSLEDECCSFLVIPTNHHVIVTSRCARPSN
jgi:hypothetical protein